MNQRTADGFHRGPALADGVHIAHVGDDMQYTRHRTCDLDVFHDTHCALPVASTPQPARSRGELIMSKNEDRFARELRERVAEEGRRLQEERQRRDREAEEERRRRG